MTVIPIVIGALSTVIEGLKKGTGGLGNNRMSEDHPKCSIIKIGLDTKNSNGDLRRLAVTQTPVEDYQLTIV